MAPGVAMEVSRVVFRRSLRVQAGLSMMDIHFKVRHVIQTFSRRRFQIISASVMVPAPGPMSLK